MNNNFQQLHQKLHSEAHLIDSERIEVLKEIARLMYQDISGQRKTEIMVICTHNSRRSQLGEVWLNVLADFYNIPEIEAYSGGMEETAFNFRMVKALREFGFELDEIGQDDNQKYILSSKGKAIRKRPYFSKAYDHTSNPSRDFIALMVCDHADENCPVVLGMKQRIPLRYTDPKAFDESEGEEQAYREKVQEIGREMVYIFEEIKRLSLI